MNAAMSVVTGTGGGTGGSTAYFSNNILSSRSTETKDLPVSGSVSGTVGSHTLSTPEIASSQSHMVFRRSKPSNNGSAVREQVAQCSKKC